MIDRTDLQFANIVKKGLIMSKSKSFEEAKRMMMRAGVPVELINRVLAQDVEITNNVRRTDFE